MGEVGRRPSWRAECACGWLCSLALFLSWLAWPLVVSLCTLGGASSWPWHEISMRLWLAQRPHTWSMLIYQARTPLFMCLAYFAPMQRHPESIYFPSWHCSTLWFTCSHWCSPVPSILAFVADLHACLLLVVRGDTCAISVDSITSKNTIHLAVVVPWLKQ